MYSKWDKRMLIKMGFYVGLAIKCVYGVFEIVGGLTVVLLNHGVLVRIIQLLAIPEITEDPKDLLMNYFIHLGTSLSLTAQHTVGIYLLLHGVAKVVLIMLLLKRKPWAYPLAVVVFCLFVGYEIISILNSASALLLIFIIMDIFIIAMILMEYRQIILMRKR